MTIATMTARGQITIPKTIRDLLHLHPGDRMEVVVQEGNKVLMQPAKGNKVLVQPAKIDVADLRGIMHRPGQPVLTIEEMDEAIAQAVCASMDNDE